LEQVVADAMAALSRRERSAAEMASWLRERGVEEEELLLALQRLNEVGALDDARFAERYAEDKRELAGWGAERIEAALRDRGIPGEYIEAALVAEGAEGERRRAVELLAERARPLTSDKDRHRALGFLARRGYSSEIAHDAVREFERRAA
jgi:regulatory protein